MKKIMSIFGVIFFASFILVGCVSKSSKESNDNSGQCKELDHSGNFRAVVNNRLKSSGKIPQLVEFNGKGSYIFQAYDTEHSVYFSGTMTVNECGEIIDVSVSLSN